VYIALPNALHHEWTMRALAAGKHVLCEKPFSRHPELVEQAFAAASAAGLVLMEGGMWRHNPQTELLVELLPQIGDLQTVRATFCFALTDAVNVRLQPELGGGALLDVGWYCVSAARLLAGEPDRAYGEAVLRGGIDVRFTGVLRSGDVTTTIECGFTHRHASLEAIGSGGSILVPDPWLVREPGLIVNGEPVAVDPANSYRLELENFAGAIRGTAEPLLGVAESLGQARILDALLASAESGHSVELRPYPPAGAVR
jgi:D-xylose 1-dehydrogenase (NADP+, D-xylono-1,5-lactone-forming)